MIEDNWKYCNQMKKYLMNKYGFVDINASKRLVDQNMIFLCYYEKINISDRKLYRHEFNTSQIKTIVNKINRVGKLERICNENI